MAAALELTKQLPSPVEVLEIGCGTSSNELAKNSGGLLFAQPNVNYRGLELPEELENAWGLEDEDRANIVAGDCSDLPFPDNYFDFVLMRSVFGQFLSKMSNPIGRFAVFQGIPEAFRGLKPGGKAVIAEENTPWDAQDIEYTLANFGFQVIDFAYMEEDTWDQVSADSAWRTLRRPYYDDVPIQEEKWRKTLFSGAGDCPPYVLIAQKPTEYEEVVSPNPLPRLFRKDYRHGKPLPLPGLTPDKYSYS